MPQRGVWCAARKTLFKKLRRKGKQLCNAHIVLGLTLQVLKMLKQQRANQASKVAYSFIN